MQIRKAVESDIHGMLDIYNYEVENGTATLDLHPKTEDEWIEWFGKHNREGDNHPLYVAEKDGVVIGYASLSPYREKEAYSSTVELSVYVHPDYRRCGIASALLLRIIDEARADDRTHAIVAVITAGNEASGRLHEKFGFTYCGTMHEVGCKSGEMQDILNYELIV